MHRTGFKMRIKLACEAIYKGKHDQIWPELLEVLRCQRFILGQRPWYCECEADLT